MGVLAYHDTDAVPGQSSLAQGGVKSWPAAGLPGVEQEPPQRSSFIRPFDQGDRAEGDRALIRPSSYPSNAVCTLWPVSFMAFPSLRPPWGYGCQELLVA
jgi:hypothetical protein